MSAFGKILNSWLYRAIFIISISLFGLRTHRRLKESVPSILLNKFYVHTKTCYSTMFFNFDDFQSAFKMIHQGAQQCSTPFKDSFDTESKTGSFGTRYIATTESELMDCKVVTLGLQKNIIMEEHLLLSYPKCTFFGVDLNNTATFDLYNTLLNGTAIQAKVDISNKILEKFDRKFNQLSLHYLLKNFYDFEKIDFFFMDINGNEIELVYDMIESYRTYPQICQLTIVIHTPLAGKNGTKFLKAIVKTLKTGPYMLTTMENKNDSNEIFEIFFVNVLDESCVKRYII